jgi:hypothetical protein
MLLLWFCGCTTVQTAGNRGFYPSRDPYRDGFPSRYTDLARIFHKPSRYPI